MNRLALLMLFVAVVLPVLGYVWWKLFNSPDGERYLKRRKQDPFVPLGSDEVAEDNARIRGPGGNKSTERGK